MSLEKKIFVLAGWMRGFFAAVGFLTVVPVGGHRQEDLGHGVRFFGIVGLLIGTVLWGQYIVLKGCLAPSLTALSLVLTGVVLTRALHLDGLADSADALLSHRDPQRMLEIMKDSRIGTMGTLALVFDVLIRWEILAHMPSNMMPAALIASSVLGRMSMGVGVVWFPYARKMGLASPFVRGVKKVDGWFVLISALVIVCAGCGTGGLLLWSAVLLAALTAFFFTKKLLGGYTGDVLGATNEMAEILCLALFLIRP